MALVKTDQRICFAIMWFDNEEEAIATGRRLTASGRIVNGGWEHGMPLGRRMPEHDQELDGVKLYAVQA